MASGQSAVLVPSLESLAVAKLALMTTEVIPPTHIIGQEHNRDIWELTAYNITELETLLLDNKTIGSKKIFPSDEDFYQWIQAHAAFIGTIKSMNERLGYIDTLKTIIVKQAHNHIISSSTARECINVLSKL
jgi:hypothetical protein